jgi:hypothetical protein
VLSLLSARSALATAFVAASGGGEWTSPATWTANSSYPGANGNAGNDTVTIGANITVYLGNGDNITVGASGAAGTVAISIQKGTLSVGPTSSSTGATLTVCGDVQVQGSATNFTGLDNLQIQAGSTLQFLCPASVQYKIDCSPASGGFYSTMACNGTQSAPCTVTSLLTNGATSTGFIHINGTANYQGLRKAYYTHFSNLNDQVNSTSSQGGIQMAAITSSLSATVDIENCTFDNMGKFEINMNSNAAGNFTFTNNVWGATAANPGTQVSGVGYNVGLDLRFNNATSGGATRTMTGDCFDLVVNLPGAYNLACQNNYFGQGINLTAAGPDFGSTGTNQTFDSNAVVQPGQAGMIAIGNVTNCWIATTFPGNPKYLLPGTNTTNTPFSIKGNIAEAIVCTSGSGDCYEINADTAIQWNMRNCFVMPDLWGLDSGVQFTGTIYAAASTPTWAGTAFTGAATTGGFLVGGTTYYYKITATSPIGETVASTEQSYTPPAGTSTNTITLNWTSDTNANGYKVYRSTTSGSEQLLATVAGGSTLTYADTSNTTPSGSPPSTAAASWVDLEHCTFFICQLQFGIDFAETVGGYTGACTSCRGNLGWSPSAVPSVLVDAENGSAVDYVTAPNANYNGQWNTSQSSGGAHYTTTNSYSLNLSTGTPGLNDVHGDPQFVDYTRSMFRWAGDYMVARGFYTPSSNRGAWATSTAYNVGDVVQSTVGTIAFGKPVWYRCVSAHTSNTTGYAAQQPGKNVYQNLHLPSMASSIQIFMSVNTATTVPTSFNINSGDSASTVQTNMNGVINGKGFAVQVTGGPVWLAVPTFPGTVFTGASTTGGNLTGGQTYYYEITATNSTGETTVSVEKSYAVPSGTNTNQITVNWTAVTGATGYKIYRGTSSGAEQLLATVGAVTSYADTSNTTPSGNAPATNSSGADLLCYFTSGTSPGAGNPADNVRVQWQSTSVPTADQVQDWHNSWELLSLYLLRTGGGKTVTDSTLNLTSASYPVALITWEAAGFRPQNPAFHNASYPSDPQTTDRNGNTYVGNADLGAMAYSAPVAGAAILNASAAPSSARPQEICEVFRLPRRAQLLEAAPPRRRKAG